MARKERKDNDERQAIQCGDPNMGPSFPWPFSHLGDGFKKKRKEGGG